MQVRDNTTRTFFAELYVTKLEKKQARSYKVITLTSSLVVKWQAVEDVLLLFGQIALSKKENSEFVLF